MIYHYNPSEHARQIEKQQNLVLMEVENLLRDFKSSKGETSTDYGIVIKELWDLWKKYDELERQKPSVVKY